MSDARNIKQFEDYTAQEFLELAKKRSKTWSDRANTWSWHITWCKTNGLAPATMTPEAFIQFLQAMMRVSTTPSRLRLSQWINHLQFYYERIGVDALRKALPEINSAKALANEQLGKSFCVYFI